MAIVEMGRECFRIPTGYLQDTSEPYVGQTRKVSKSDYFAASWWSTGVVSDV